MNTIYYLRPHHEHPDGAWAVVGWDAARSTFYAQVAVEYVDYVDGDSHLHNHVRVGGAPRELTAAREALNAVAPYAEVPPDLEAMLEADAGPPAHRQPTVLTVNHAAQLVTEGITTWLDGSDEPTAWTAQVNASHPDDRNVPQSGVVAQAFPPLYHVGPADGSGTSPALGTPSRPHRQGRQR
jgi:hypothetical protein